MKSILAAFVVAAISILNGCNPNSGRQSDIKNHFERIANLDHSYELPDNWIRYQSTENRFEIAIPSDDKFTDSYYVTFGPTRTFGVSNRPPMQSAEQIIAANRGMFVGFGSVLYSTDTKNERETTQVFGFDSGHELYQLVKIVVTDHRVYVMTVHFNGDHPDDFTDERLVTYFRSFKLTNEPTK